MLSLGLAALTLAGAGIGLALAWDALGALPSGERLARVEASPNFEDGRFRSPVPVRPYTLAAVWQMVKDYAGGQEREPAAPPPVERRRAED